MASTAFRPSLVVSIDGIDDIAAAAALAERSGFESVWATEFYDRSATIALAAMTQATEAIELGSAIAYAFGRTPLVLAAEARDLDALCGGRLTLGLGTGTAKMQRDWHGIDGEHSAPRMEELVPLVRRLWRLHEGPLEHEGRFWRLDIRPTAPVAPPLREEIPIYMGGVNPRMLEAVGAVGDGLIGHPLYTPEYVTEVVRPALARGAERAGRDPEVPIAGYVTCCVDEDGDAARRDASAIVAFNSTVSTYQGILRMHGFDAEADGIRSAWEARDFAAMVEGVSPRMLETIAVAGTPEEARDQLRARGPDLYERTLFWPPAFRGLDGIRAVVEAFAEPL